MCSVISILPICRNIVHHYLFYLWTKVVLAPFDSAAPIRAGTWEVMGAMFMGETDNTPALACGSAEVVWGLTVLVEMAWHLAVLAGMAVMVASKASGL
jgi:hypothetical protein